MYSLHETILKYVLNCQRTKNNVSIYETGYIYIYIYVSDRWNSIYFIVFFFKVCTKAKVVIPLKSGIVISERLYL